MQNRFERRLKIILSQSHGSNQCLLMDAKYICILKKLKYMSPVTRKNHRFAV